MHFTPALLLAAGIASVVAAPAAPIEVTVDDVILYGSGRSMVMKRSEFLALELARNSSVPPPAPAGMDPKLTGAITYTGEDCRPSFSANETIPHPPRGPLNKREINTIIIPNPNQHFLGWDVQMSSVVKGAPTTIMVNAGYQISNAITVGGGIEASPVKDYLSISLKIDYTKTWTSTQANTYTAPVPEGKYGAFVSNPWTDRASGNVWSGTIGGGGKLTYYSDDSYTSKQFGDLAWVDGLIVLCVKDKFPLTRCLGSGTI